MNIQDDPKARGNALNNEKVEFKDLYLKTREHYFYLKSKIFSILIWGIIGMTLGIGMAFLKKPVYSAITTFVLEDGDKSGGGILGQYSGIASMAGLDLGAGGGIFQGDNILELYKSRAMIQKTLLTKVVNNGKEELLIDAYFRMNSGNKKNLNSGGIISKFGNSTRLKDSILGKAVEDINRNVLFISKPDKKLSIIMVEIKAKDESFAKTFNEQIVNTVNNFYILTKTKKALQNVSILQHQADSVKRVLNGAINKTINVADATPNLNPGRQILRAPAQYFQLEAEASKAIFTEIAKNLELAKISLRKDTPLIQVIDIPIYPLDVEKTGKLKAGLIGFLIGSILSVSVLLIKAFLERLLN
jgi:hypothetical protein